MADHMITTYRDKAERWVQQAEKAHRRVYMDTITHFKFQDVSYYQELAAQCFRVAKRFQDAGVAYKHCGRLEERLKKPEIAAFFYHEAALCFQKDDPQEAAACYHNSINLYCQIKRFSTAARLETEVAELMEKDRNRPLAIVHYIKAADFYRANMCCDKAADRCLRKVAHALGICERYVEAASLFQVVGRRMLADDLLKFNSPEAFLKAVLCMQCASGMAPNQQRESQPHDRNPGAEQPSPQPATGSVRAMLVSLGKFSSIFRGSRAYLFASDMVQAGKDGDVHLFAARVYAYDNVCRLDAWYLRILKIIHGHVEEKSARNTKIRAMQAKLRRRQLAEERARTRMRSRQHVSIESDDSSEGTLSQGTRSNASSSEATLSANRESNTMPAGKGSSYSSTPGSDSSSESSSGTESGSSSLSSSADDLSHAQSGSGELSEGSDSGSDDSSSSGSGTSGEENVGGPKETSTNGNSKRSAEKKNNPLYRDHSRTESSSPLSSTGSGSSGHSGISKSTPGKSKASKTTKGSSPRSGSDSESEYSQEGSDSGSKEDSVARSLSRSRKGGKGKTSSGKKRGVVGKKDIDKQGKGKEKSGFWRRG